ncbi:hypothetical protein BT63DRAFT_448396 [Microthyrium microscopicum]|uniref:Protein-lysine N-methyltransferase EFM5 n=1 Tax=Microthyrium microscopicum TaxID=703497 RepID=A0A6A6TZ09_9PEZI|nr:hypothetical protein BT63DRAFT_448396 [Microthyrium microscopicum]
MAESDDDMPQLSGDALAALKDFYSERDTRQKLFEDLKSGAEADHDDRTEQLSMAAFTEDWNASQFWYTEETANALAVALLEDTDESDHIAFVSAPSAFLAAKRILAKNWKDKPKPHLALLEFDDRFAVFKEFVQYDFNAPLKLPTELKGTFSRIIVDPPFLSEECQTKAALTVRYMAKSWTEGDIRVISCTGERMEALIHKLYAKVGIKTTSFEVKHQKGLSNEFRCYANFEPTFWKFQDSIS